MKIDRSIKPEPRKMPETFTKAQALFKPPVPVDINEQLIKLRDETPPEFHEEFKDFFEAVQAISPQ